jgi:hypothetical protein
MRRGVGSRKDEGGNEIVVTEEAAFGEKNMEAKGG